MAQVVKKKNALKENTRIIDNNALAEAKILAYQEAQRAKQERQRAQAPPVLEDFGEEFEEGLNADQLEQLTADQDSFVPTDPGMEGAFQDGEYPQDGYAESEIPPDAGLFQDTQDTVPQAQMPTPDMSAIVQDAQAQAEQILADAQAQAEQVLRSAQQEGYDRGYTEGMDAAKQAAMAEVEEELQQRRDELEREYQKALDEMEPTMVETLTRIYEHVFDVNLRNEKQIILHLLQTTLSRVEAEGNFIVHLSPTDYDTVADEKDRLRAAIVDPSAQLELVEDPLMHENECMIETDGGIFDCSLGVELAELTRKLKLLAFDRRRN